MGAYEKPAVRRLATLQELTLGDTFGEWEDLYGLIPFYNEPDEPVQVS